jgi:hypothetical protein
MKRVVALLVLAAALAVSAATASAASPTEPPASLACLNIEGGTGFVWDGSNLSGSITLAAPACKQATYTLVILDDSSSTTPLATTTGTPAGAGDVVVFNTAVSDTDGTVGVYATSSIGGRVFDVGAPTGLACLDVDNTGSSPATPFH